LPAGISALPSTGRIWARRWLDSILVRTTGGFAAFAGDQQMGVVGDDEAALGFGRLMASGALGLKQGMDLAMKTDALRGVVSAWS
jgi:hypothetical protein